MTNSAPSQPVFKWGVISIFVTCCLVTCTERTERSPEDVASLTDVASLIETLKDEHPYVRTAAAYTLGQIGPDAKAAVPNLIEALKDEDVRMKSVADALGGIATALQREKDTTAIPDLEMALIALRAANAPEDFTADVLRAVEALKAIEKRR